MAFTLEFMQNITKDPENQRRQIKIADVIERIKRSIMAGHYTGRTCLHWRLPVPEPVRISYHGEKHVPNREPTTCIRDELIESLQKEFPGCLVFASDTDVHIDWTIS